MPETDQSVSLEKLLAQLGELGNNQVKDFNENAADQDNPGANKKSGKQAAKNLNGHTECSATVGDIIYVVGDRSFAPLLMLVGMLLVSPLSGVPAFPSMIAVILLLVTLQMLFGRKKFWLPAKLLQVRVSCEKLNIALKWLLPSARFFDRITMPRLTLLVRGPSVYVIAAICLSIVCLLPLMELILFSSSVIGAVLMIFGVALVSRDGLLALLGYGATAIAYWLIGSAVL